MSILITGGTGYIGSHTVVELQKAGRDVVIADNLSNSKLCVLDRIEAITGRRPAFHLVDLCDRQAAERLFDAHPDIDAVIHFAGLKAVGESVTKPLEYYRNNLLCTLVLCSVMQERRIGRIVFSSSATVYGIPEHLPARETDRLYTTNPYGETKLMIERILSDWADAQPSVSACVLRYFNPIGAHESGLIGEDPRGIPNNLLPYVARVAAGKLPCVNVFGNDYDTPDGTGVRDYIHVVDLARAHLAALDYTQTHAGVDFFNIGTGKGYSVLEVIRAFGLAWGAEIPYVVTARRPGDIASNYADVTKARTQLGWTAQYDLARMCTDAARWQKQNPDGYPD